MIKIISKHKRIFLKYALVVFLILSISTLIVRSFLQFKLNDAQKSKMLNNEEILIKTENTVISNRIGRISGDLLYIADCFKINDLGDGNYSETEKQWVAFSNRKMIYDQIRFIDIEGNEIIRVNYGKNGAVLIGEDELQNKKDRYYFTDTINLKENQIYISKMDLNIEKNEIEQPIKPMIRISTPYYVGGQLKGIFILNYLADDILNQVKQIASSSNGNIFLLNSDGFWLYNSSDVDKEWAFMYNDKADVRFNNEFSDEWQSIINNKNGYQISENGVFVYSSVITNTFFDEENVGYSYVLGSGDWHLLSFVSLESASGSYFNDNFITNISKTLRNDYYLYISILIIAITVAVLVVINKNEKEKIKYFSEFDVMTGVYNRRAGFEKLTQLYKKSSNKNCIISICFIDINGLKEVNDNLGHEAGDELILGVVDGIKKNIRDNDFVARLGGDEFLIIFEGLDEAKAEDVWERIVKYYNNINNTEKRKYLISVSHGIESFQCDSNQYIDTIVNRADEKMYNEKRIIKKNLKVLN